jgi:hypothetical protein
MIEIGLTSRPGWKLRVAFQSEFPARVEQEYRPARALTPKWATTRNGDNSIPTASAVRVGFLPVLPI